ncbi:hypothetical protein HK104_007901 [Borealophlyctis nickersoniae]|nr:hypothetical protein HK104_007901 [Borealophlyctis nickersoniae]
MTDTVDELAKQGKKHRSSKMPAIPIGLVISCLIAMALIAVCAPMGTILANNSKDVVSDLSDIVMRDTVSSVVKGVTTLLATANSFTTAVARSLIVKNVMTTNFTDLEHQPEIVNLFFK